jgi:hypothetical protein
MNNLHLIKFNQIMPKNKATAVKKIRRPYQFSDAFVFNLFSSYLYPAPLQDFTVA